MARIYHALGDFEESEILRRELCQEYDSNLGSDHPVTREAYYQLAQTFKDACKETVAIEILEPLLRKITVAGQLNSLESRRIMFVLEYLYRRVNNLRQAETIRQDLQSQRKSISSETPTVSG